MHAVCCLLGLLTLSGALAAGEIPPGGAPVLPDEAAIRMSLPAGNLAGRSVVSIPDMPFTRAVQVRTVLTPARTWDVQLSLGTTAPIREGDILLAVFWARGIQSSEETGEVYSEFIFERSADPWTKSATYAVMVVGDWKQFFVPFRSAEAYGSGQASVKFRLGYKPQTIQIGGLELWNYGKSVALADLPRPSISYRGMEPEAAWRRSAEQRMERHRKGDLQIVVQDAERKPVAGAQVHVHMTRHAYRFGAAVDARTLMGEGRDHERYRQTVQTYFNRVVLENDLKWPRWETGDRPTTLSALDTLKNWGIEIRGHTLVWPSWRYLPADLEANKHNPEYLRSRVLTHIEAAVGTLAGRLVDWDVVNENYWNHDLMDILGDHVMVDWYRKAHASDPRAKLYLNDNNIISGGGTDQAHRNHYLGTARFLLDNGAPLHGLGTQCHFGSNPTPPDRIWAILDELNTLGLEIQATEFDIDSDDPEYQANYTRDFMTAYFAHPSTVGIVMWGFWEGKHWRPKAALWDRKWNLRPHGRVWIDLVTKTWWTDETLSTDPSGKASVRGFLGDYTITVRYHGQTIRTDVRHQSGGTAVHVAGSKVEIQSGIPAADPERLVH